MDILTAAQNGYIQKVKELLDKGIYVDTHYGYGRTALIYASEQGNEALVRLLLDRGADVNAKDGGNVTALHKASYGHPSVVRLLLERGADINAEDKGERRPLINAVKNGHDEVSKILIEKGANVNIKDSDGITPLEHAIEGNQESIVRLLLAKGADPETKNHIGKPLVRMARGKIRNMLTDAIARKGARAAGEALTVKPVQELVAGLKGTAPAPGPPTYLPPGVPERITRFMARPAAPPATGIYAPGAGAGPGAVRGGRKTRRSKKRRFSRRR
jgi:ankyrin repeat protein